MPIFHFDPTCCHPSILPNFGGFQLSVLSCTRVLLGHWHITILAHFFGVKINWYRDAWIQHRVLAHFLSKTELLQFHCISRSNLFHNLTIGLNSMDWSNSLQGPDLSLVSDPDSGFGGPGVNWEKWENLKFDWNLISQGTFSKNLSLTEIQFLRGPSPPSHILLLILSRVGQWLRLLSQ